MHSKTKTFLAFYAHFLNSQVKIGLFVLFETAKMHFEQILKLFWLKNVPYKRKEKYHLQDLMLIDV